MNNQLSMVEYCHFKKFLEIKCHKKQENKGTYPTPNISEASLLFIFGSKPPL